MTGCEFRVHNPPTLPNTVSWLGGSLVAAIQDFSKKFVTKEYYKQVSKHECERILLYKNKKGGTISIDFFNF